MYSLLGGNYLELSEEQLVVIAKGLRDKKPESGWEGVFVYVKKSSLFKGWKVPDSKIKYIAEVINTYDSLLGSDGFKGFENYAPKSSESKPTKDSNATSVKPSKSGSSKPKKQGTKSKKSSSAIMEQAMNVIDYQVVRDKTLSGLEAKVKAEMRRGWIPYGGVGSAAFGMSPLGGNSFMQAVVKIK